MSSERRVTTERRTHLVGAVLGAMLGIHAAIAGPRPGDDLPIGVPVVVAMGIAGLLLGRFASSPTWSTGPIVVFGALAAWTFIPGVVWWTALLGMGALVSGAGMPLIAFVFAAACVRRRHTPGGVR